MKNDGEVLEKKVTRILGIMGIILEIVSILAEWNTLPVVIMVSLLLGAGIVWWQQRFDSYRKNSVLLSNLYIDGRPMASDIQYLLKSRLREKDSMNKLFMKQVWITYDFVSANAEKETAMQTFTWNFKGDNQTKENIMHFHIYSHNDEVSNAVKIKHIATDNRTGKELYIEKTKQNDIFSLDVKFDEEGIRSKELFDFQVQMRWEEAVKLAPCETILIDLDNYTNQDIGEVKIKITSDMEGFDKRYIEVYHVDRMTLDRTSVYNTCMKKCQNAKSESEFVIKREKEQRLFLILIKK